MVGVGAAEVVKRIVFLPPEVTIFAVTFTCTLPQRSAVALIPVTFVTTVFFAVALVA